MNTQISRISVIVKNFANFLGLPQPTLSEALSLWQWGVGQTNGGKDGGPSLRSGMGCLVGDLKWVKTGVIFLGAGL